MIGYALPGDGSFAVRDFQRAPPFSSFLSGIAGVLGVPAWAHYVNRGQAVCTFGTRDKDHCIVEFESARLHQHRVALEGFRTFVRYRVPDGTTTREPFARWDADGTERTLTVRPHEIELREEDRAHGLRTTVRYTVLPGESFPALLRWLRLENRGDVERDCEILDGLPRLLPYGYDFDLLKTMPFVGEGYCQVAGVADGMVRVRQKAQSSDGWETPVLAGANFFAATAPASGGSPELLRPVVDVERVFGPYGDLVRPYGFLAEEPFDPTAPQALTCRTPCAFVHRRVRLGPGAAAEIHACYGAVADRARLPAVRRRLLAPGFLPAKFVEAEAETDAVRHRCFLASGRPEFDAYLPQTYLDNVLRGGLPLSQPTADGGVRVLHVYARKHGDLERDYNRFTLAATRYSQGDGNFRDVNQNRRHDVWFNPDVGAANVRYFADLIQPDGFNPLLCLGRRFRVDDAAGCARAVAATGGQAVADALAGVFAGPFAPGDLFARLDADGLAVAEPERLLATVLAGAEVLEEAEFGEGYWTDHWLYLLDQIEAYLAIFPERRDELLFSSEGFTYFDTHVRVLPRSAKQVRLADGRIAQADCLDEDPVKRALIDARKRDPHKVRVDGGRGVVYTCNLLQKMLCVVVNKLASPAPSGLGLAMDGGRPGWNDSINGLPGLFGATTSELFHLRRWLRWLRAAIADAEPGFAQPLPIELADLLRAVTGAQEGWAAGDRSSRDHRYWDAVNDAKEAYRERVHRGFDGSEERSTASELIAFLDAAAVRIDDGLERCVDPESGFHRTYVRHEAVAFVELTDARGRTRLHPRLGVPLVRVDAFRPRRLAPFLEAPAHALRCGCGGLTPVAVHAAVRASSLYDRELGMYITGEDLEAEGPAVGRLWAWQPGWFENQNVFLHLEHKYLLGLLHAGLYDDFFADAERCLLPCQPPERLARNPLENASFIMSSRQQAPWYRGRGFQPRSSGTTAEVLEMFLHLGFGPRPFRAGADGPVLRFAPVLPGGWFHREGGERDFRRPDGSRRREVLPPDAYAMLFLGHCLVVYSNPGRADTFGTNAARVVACRLRYDDGSEAVTGPEIPTSHARAVRERRVARIDCRLDRRPV